MLAGDVKRGIGKADNPAHRSIVDNRAAALSQHRFRLIFHRPENPTDVRVEDRVVDFVCLIDEGRELPLRARIVECDVQPTINPYRRGDQIADARLDIDVRDDRRGLKAILFDLGNECAARWRRPSLRARPAQGR